MKVTDFSVFVRLSAYCRRPEPLMTTSVFAWIEPDMLALTAAKLLPPRPPLIVSVPAGRTAVPATVGLRFNVPWLTVVPPVKVLTAVRSRMPVPDLTRLTELPKPLSAMTELMMTSPRPTVKAIPLAAVAVAGLLSVSWVRLSTERT